jgi:hypothetical protein
MARISRRHTMRIYLYEVFQLDGERKRKVAKYKTMPGLRKKLGLYAEVMPEAVVEVEVAGCPYNVRFENERNEQGEVIRCEWTMEPACGGTNHV